MKNHRAQWVLANLIIVMLLPLIFAGCKTTPPAKDEVIEGWRAKAKESQASSPRESTRKFDQKIIIPEKQDDKKDAKKIAVKKVNKVKPLPKEKVTMLLKETEVGVVLHALAKMVKQNLMMNTEVDGKINVNINDTPWNQVFLGILKTRGLSYKWEGDIIRVMAIQDLRHDNEIAMEEQKKEVQLLQRKQIEPLLTRIFYIDYAEIDDLKPILEEMLTKELVTDGLSFGSGSAVKTGGAGKRTEKAGYASTSLSESTRGSVVVDKHNKALVVKAIADDIKKIEAVVAALDRPTTQILVEANIIETNRETAKALGVSWGGAGYNNSGSTHYGIAGQKSGVIGNSINDAFPPNTDLGVHFPADIEDRGVIVDLFAGNVGDFLLSAQITALEEASKLNILSNPSVTTLDNQVATIESGAEVPFQTINEEGQIEIEFKDASLKLEVTPHVIDENSLKLNILITKDELDFTQTVNGFPTILTKRTETSVILKNGQTTIIGGLTKETQGNDKANIPGLGDVPLFNYIFGSKSASNELDEILIFITPHILEKR